MNFKKTLMGKYLDCGKEDEASNLLFGQYGKEENIEDEWKKIIQKESKDEFISAIDELINKMEQNSENNGFFGAKQVVKSESLAGFVLDDKDLYYRYFIYLKQWSDKAKNEGRTNADGLIIFNAIKQTINDYLGPINENSRDVRKSLTNPEFKLDENGNDDFIFPSIKNQKRKGSGICTERAAISHNLWLLTGRESYFISSQDCEFGDENLSTNDGHSFCIVNTGTKYKLCDFAMGKFNELDGNPLKKIKQGEPLEFDGLVYTDAGKLNIKQ